MKGRFSPFFIMATDSTSLEAGMYLPPTWQSVHMAVDGVFKGQGCIQKRGGGGGGGLKRNFWWPHPDAPTL